MYIWLSHLEVLSFTARRSRFLLVSTITNFLCLTGTWFCLYWVFPGPLGGAQDGSACVYIANYHLFVRDGKTGPRRGVVLSMRPALGVTARFQHQQALKGWAVGQRPGTAVGTPHVSQDGRGTAGQQLWPFTAGAFFGVYYRGSPGWVRNLITSNISHGTFIAWKPRITIEVTQQDFQGRLQPRRYLRWGNPQRAFVMRTEAASSSFWHVGGTVLLANAGQPPSARCTTLDSSWHRSYQLEIVTCFSSTVPQMPHSTLFFSEPFTSMVKKEAFLTHSMNGNATF